VLFYCLFFCLSLAIIKKVLISNVSPLLNKKVPSRRSLSYGGQAKIIYQSAPVFVLAPFFLFDFFKKTFLAPRNPVKPRF